MWAFSRTVNSSSLYSLLFQISDLRISTTVVRCRSSNTLNSCREPEKYACSCPFTSLNTASSGLHSCRGVMAPFAFGKQDGIGGYRHLPAAGARSGCPGLCGDLLNHLFTLRSHRSKRPSIDSKPREIKAMSANWLIASISPKNTLPSRMALTGSAEGRMPVVSFPFQMVEIVQNHLVFQLTLVITLSDEC